MTVSTAAAVQPREDRLTEKQTRLLVFIGDFRREHFYGPTIKEIADGLGGSYQSVLYRVANLVEKGFLTRAPLLRRTLRVVDQPSPLEPRALEKAVETLVVALDRLSLQLAELTATCRDARAALAVTERPVSSSAAAAPVSKPSPVQAAPNGAAEPLAGPPSPRACARRAFFAAFGGHWPEVRNDDLFRHRVLELLLRLKEPLVSQSDWTLEQWVAARVRIENHGMFCEERPCPLLDLAREQLAAEAAACASRTWRPAPSVPTDARMGAGEAGGNEATAADDAPNYAYRTGA